MSIDLTEYQIEMLRIDAKTLVDISRMMEMDGRFKVLPSILNGIASDIESVAIQDQRGDSGKEVVV